MCSPPLQHNHRTRRQQSTASVVNEALKGRVESGQKSHRKGIQPPRTPVGWLPAAVLVGWFHFTFVHWLPLSPNLQAFVTPRWPGLLFLPFHPFLCQLLLFHFALSRMSPSRSRIGERIFFFPPHKKWSEKETKVEQVVQIAVPGPK